MNIEMIFLYKCFLLGLWYPCRLNLQQYWHELIYNNCVDVSASKDFFTKGITRPVVKTCVAISYHWFSHSYTLTVLFTRLWIFRNTIAFLSQSKTPYLYLVKLFQILKCNNKVLLQTSQWILLIIFLKNSVLMLFNRSPSKLKTSKTHLYSFISKVKDKHPILNSTCM